jgi:hypothetical protein
MKSPVRSPQAPGQTARGRSYDRHSATGSRGLPKKNGAGGKGVWGAMIDQEGDGVIVDKNDPNYDSDEERAAFDAAEAAAARGEARNGGGVDAGEPPVMILANAQPPAAGSDGHGGTAAVAMVSSSSGRDY